jgi:hypothetical protein
VRLRMRTLVDPLIFCSQQGSSRCVLTESRDPGWELS